MKKSFARFLAASAFGLFSLLSVTRAQETPPPPPAGLDQPPPPPVGGGRRRGARMLEGLKQKLSLTDAQFTQVKAIMKDEMQQLRALHDDDSATDDDKRAKAHAIRESGRQKVRALLTADQQKIFDTLPRPGRRGEDGPPPPDAPPPAN